MVVAVVVASGVVFSMVIASVGASVAASVSLAKAVVGGASILSKEPSYVLRYLSVYNLNNPLTLHE
jgi:hypothetical protein